MAKASAEGVAFLRAYVNSFSGGMVTTFPFELLSPNCSTRLQNVVLDDTQALSRFGFTRLNPIELSTAAPIRSMWHGQGSGLLGNKLVCISGDKIFSINADTGVATDISAASYSTTQRWDFAEATLGGVARIIMVAPGNAPVHWDGVAPAVTPFTGPATFSDYAMYHASRLWLADGDLRTIYASKKDSFSVFDPNDNVIVGKEEDGPITKLVPMGRYAVIFMQKTIYMMFGNRIQVPRNLTIERVDFEDGCPAPWSVAKIGQFIFWVGNEGINGLRGRVAKKLSRSIEPDYDLISRTAIHRCVGIRQGNMYWVSVPVSASTNNRTYATHWNLPPNDYGDFPWSYFLNLVGNSFAYNPGRRRTYFGLTSGGFAYYYDPTVTTDNGTPIDYDVITRGLHFGDPLLQKVLTIMQAQAETVAAGTLAVSTGINKDDVAAFLSTPASISLSPTGLFMGEYGGEESFDRHGIVNYPLHVTPEGAPRIGNWFRVRLRDSGATTRRILQRLYFEALPKVR